jgi:hypothetical protein
VLGVVTDKTYMYAVSMNVLGVHLLQQHAAFNFIVTTYIVQNSALEVSTCVHSLNWNNKLSITCIYSDNSVITVSAK